MSFLVDYVNTELDERDTEEDSIIIAQMEEENMKIREILNVNIDISGIEDKLRELEQ